MGGELVLRSDISRRGFLGGLAAGAIVVAIPGTSQALVRPVSASSTGNIIVVRRREDLLRLVVDGTTMSVNKAQGRLEFATAGALRIDFGPQSLVEEAVAEGVQRPPTPRNAQLSGPSRIGFRHEGNLSLSLATLLSWAERVQNIDPLGEPLDGEDVPEQADYGKGPNPWVTAIEMPWWLVLSPHRDSSWTEQVRPKTRGGMTEIFHTRLATTQAGSEQTEDPESRTVRGIWIRDPNPFGLLSDPNASVARGQTGHPWLMVPTPRDRADIVRLSTRVSGDTIGGPAPAVKASVALSALGGHLAAEGSWDAPGVSSMTAWQQRIWQGRDTYAKVVRAGFLYPWGFPASFVTEGIRVFKAAGGGTGREITAFWQIRESVIVTDPDRDLGGGSGGSDAGKRGALFTSVHCRTIQTPPLAPSGNESPGNQWARLKTFTPEVLRPGGGRTPFAFELVGVDPDGNEVPFTQPLFFAERAVSDQSPRRGRAIWDDPNFSDAGAAQLREYYESRVPRAKKVADFAGGVVSFAVNVANSISGPDGETITEMASRATSQGTSTMVFGIANSLGIDNPLPLLEGTVQSLAENLNPNNFPILEEAEVYLGELSQLAGDTVTAALNYPREFLEDGFDDLKNRGQVFLQQAQEEATEFAMDAARAGGVMAAKLGIGGLSRSLGPIYGTATELKSMAADGRITPGEALKSIELLGGVSLADIIPNPYPAVGPDGKPTDKALKVSHEIVDVGLDSERAVIVMSMAWNDGLTTIPLLKVDDATLSINLVTEVPTVSGSASWSVRGEFANFSVVLVPTEGMEFVEVIVDKIVFVAGSGRSASVDVAVRTVDFGGLLQLIKKLQDLLPFGDGLAIDVDSRGISADLTLDVPDLILGTFTLSGIGVKTGLTLPFDDRPVRFRFGMSGLDDPFSMTVLGLGGGGWFTDDLGLDGIERLDIAGFFEAKAAVDFGVASGGVSVKAGFQFSVGPPAPGADDALALTAFVSVNGNVDVLGIASATLDIYIGLSVVVPATLPGDVLLKGRADCSLRVSVAFFSKTVRFGVERSFKGARIPAPSVRSIDGRAGRRSEARDGDAEAAVTFRDGMSRAAWIEFCGAFA
jgi:hypothetical protein